MSDLIQRLEGATTFLLGASFSLWIVDLFLDSRLGNSGWIAIDVIMGIVTFWFGFGRIALVPKAH